MHKQTVTAHCPFWRFGDLEHYVLLEAMIGTKKKN